MRYAKTIISTQTLTVLIMTLSTVLSFAQITEVSGIIIDSISKDPIPFGNVLFKGTSNGTSSDVDGHFQIKTTSGSDTLIFSYIGYTTKSIKVDIGSKQTIKVLLKPSSFTIDEFVVESDKDFNPAHRIFKGIIANKNKYNLDKFEYVEYEAYNKVEFDINNMSEKLKQSKVMKPLSFVFENADTINGKEAIPFFITETVSDIYYRKSPRKRKEIIKASKISGLKNEEIEKYFGDMDQNINVYKNYIPIFGKNFISPLSNFGLLKYKYYLVDSTTINNYHCYELKFTPKFKEDLTFTGSFWVADSSFFLIKISGDISKNANINYIKSIQFDKEFEPINDSIWTTSKESILFDFNLLKKATGFFGRKTSSYKNYALNIEKPDYYYKGENVEKLDLPDSLINWDSLRHDTLSAKEAKIYSIVDSVKNLPIFNKVEKTLRLLVGGYFEAGPISIGPYSSLYGFNIVEGHRFRLGLKTNRKLSKRFQLETFLAYGTKDQAFKWGSDIKIRLHKKKWNFLKLKYKDDIERFGLDGDKFKNNIFSIVFSRRPIRQLTRTREFNIELNKDWSNEFNTIFGIKHRTVTPQGDFKFMSGPSTDVWEVNNLTTLSPYIKLTYSKNAKWISTAFSRSKIITNDPQLWLYYETGIPGIWYSDFEYHKIKLGLDHEFYIGSMGFSRYSVELGKTFGQVPYPLQEIHPGNEGYGFELKSFNSMNYSEFVSDQYASLFYTHHFGGILFNKIPGIKKLKLREVAGFRMVYGNTVENKKQLFHLPEGTFLLNGIYAEAHVGIENILNLFRVEMVFRLTQLNNPFVQKYGIRARFDLKF